MEEFDCKKCRWSFMCKLGYVIDCETGQVYDYPSDEEYATAVAREVKAQNGEY